MKSDRLFEVTVYYDPSEKDFNLEGFVKAIGGDYPHAFIHMSPTLDCGGFDVEIIKLDGDSHQEAMRLEKDIVDIIELNQYKD